MFKNIGERLTPALAQVGRILVRGADGSFMSFGRPENGALLSGVYGKSVKPPFPFAGLKQSCQQFPQLILARTTNEVRQST